MNTAELIPAILAKNEEEFRRKTSLVEHVAQTIQIDVMDGRFVPNTTWADPHIIREMHLPFVFEVHLMVDFPETVVDDWIMAGAQRIIPHIEAEGNPRVVVETVRAIGRESGLAINPETSIAEIEDILDELDLILVMGVNPGWSGQPFQEIALEKVAELKQLRPNLRVEVDGGVNPKIAKDLVSVGCDGIVAASALFEADDLDAAVREFRKAIGAL